MSTKRPQSSPFRSLSSTSSSKRTETPKLIDSQLLLKSLEKLGIPESNDTLCLVRQALQDAINVQLPELVKEKKIIPSSTVEIPDVRSLLGVTYDEESKDCVWKITEVDEPLRMGTTWAEAALHDIKTNKDWGIETCDAMSRAIADIIIFDRKCLLSKSSSFHPLRLVDEYPIVAQTIEDSTTINGCCDLVLGYGGSGKKDLTFGLVAIETKKRYSVGTVSAQLVAYLVGLQQRHRAAGKIVQCVYGIVTDGFTFNFHRLDDKLHLQCVTVPPTEKALIYRYIDIILESALRSTPNTTPNSKFPASGDEFRRSVEKPLWSHPIPFAAAMVDVHEFDFVIVGDENGQPCLKRAGDIYNYHEEEEEKDNF